MALVIKQNKRLQHPTEAGAWVVMSVPLSAGDLELVRVDGGRVAASIDLLAKVIQEWSYGVPVTVDNIRGQDIDTFNWLSQAVIDESGIRTSEEKKDSSSSSPATTAQAVEPSLVSSAT